MPKKMPEKPTALLLYEQSVEMKIPLVAGGVRDQPHIWLMEYAVCSQEVTRYEAIRAANKAQSTGGNNAR